MISMPRIYESKASSFLVQTCQRILGFLDQAHQYSPAKRKAASLETSPEGILSIRKILPQGLELLAESGIPKTASLRIFFDPPRFSAWKAAQGNLGLFYANPYGIEIVYDQNVWGFFVDEKQLPIRLKETKIHEVASLEIRRAADTEAVEVYLQQPGGKHALPSSPKATPMFGFTAPAPRILSDQDQPRTVPEQSGTDEQRDIRNRLLAALG